MVTTGIDYASGPDRTVAVKQHWNGTRGIIEQITEQEFYMTASKEIYNSTTHGPIPLGFTARHLLQNLRESIKAAIQRGCYDDPRHEVAHARGELAKYISNLEGREKSVQPLPPASVSETFRRNPAMRKWETSYTRQVVDQVLRAFPTHGRAAASLLIGYWTDLHVPYEQRDEARAERDEAQAESKRIGEVCDRFRKELSHQDEVIEKLREALAEAKKPKTNNALLTKAASPFVAPSPSFRCIHWPLATSNILDGRTTCEHGCHTVPLEFWHNGTHRAPLNRNWQSQTAGSALQQNGANRV